MNPVAPEPAYATPSVLIVDDSVANLTVLGESLVSHFRVRTATSGRRALQMVGEEAPDLILLDIMMPEMSGQEVMARLRTGAATADIPVIFVTALDDEAHEAAGLGMGAVDYITKPLRPAIVLARVQTHLALERARQRLRADKAALESHVQRQARDNHLLRDVTLRALSRLAQTRDNETGLHLQRTQEMVRHLAGLARSLPAHASELDDATVETIAASAPLHDIGKVGIPDRILHKPGPLDADEWVVMRTHAAIGADAIAGAEADAGEAVGWLVHAKHIARHHHERWDGRGYPDRLAGAQIPLAARLMAIADVFDAMSSRRVYKAPMPLEDLRVHMAAERGRQFDPELLDLFLAHYGVFCDIARRLADPE